MFNGIVPHSHKQVTIRRETLARRKTLRQAWAGNGLLFLLIMFVGYAEGL